MHTYSFLAWTVALRVKEYETDGYNKPLVSEDFARIWTNVTHPIEPFRADDVHTS